MMGTITISRHLPDEVPVAMREDVELCLNRYVDLYEIGQHPYWHLPSTNNASNWLPLAPAAAMANYIFQARHLEQYLFLPPVLLAGWAEASHGTHYQWHFFRVSHHPICEARVCSIDKLQHAIPRQCCPGCAARLVPELLKSTEPSAELAVQQISKAAHAFRAPGSPQENAPQQSSLFPTVSL